MTIYNKANNEVKLRQGKRLEKYICKDCNKAFYEYDYNLCPHCDSVQSGDKTNTLYIIADCFSYHNGKPDQMAGYATIVCNDRFDLDDKFNIEYVNRKAFEGTTNNFGELMGVIDGLAYFINEELHEVYDNVKVISDSQYVIFGADHRMYKWRAAGWRNTMGEVKNKEMWITMMEAVETIKSMGINLEFIHQKGHVGKTITKEEDPIIYLQEKCDTIAVDLKNKLVALKNK